jgi:hypothetical protein
MTPSIVLYCANARIGGGRGLDLLRLFSFSSKCPSPLPGPNADFIHYIVSTTRRAIQEQGTFRYLGPMLWFLKHFRWKIQRKNLSFLTQNKAKLCKIFEKNANFFDTGCCVCM